MSLLFLLPPLLVSVARCADESSSPITGYDGLFRTESSEATSVQLPSDSHLPGAPSWLVGDFMLAGTHEFEMGPTRFNHAFDAFGRIMRFHLQPGEQRSECTFSAKMMPTQYYLKAKAAGRIVAGLHFEDTVPSLNASIVRKLMGPGDNVYVQQLYFGGKYWSTTDGPSTLNYNKDFSGFESVKWQDWLGLQTQVTHSIVRPETGKLYGLGSHTSSLVLYEIDPAKPYERVKLVSFDVPHLPYEHSFGLGGDYAVVCAHPFTMDPMKMMSKNMIDAMVYDKNGNTTFHLVNLKTQAIEKFVAPPYIIYHFANIQEEPNGDISFAQPTATCNVYYLFHMPTALSSEALDRFRDTCEVQLRRFTLHRSGSLAGTVTSSVVDPGWTEFPQFNQFWRGKNTSCYLYMIEWYHGGSSEYASMAIVKIDTCQGTRTAVWSVRGHFPGEPKFIPRPKATEEDDGVIISPVLDGVAQSSYLLVLDAKTMKPLERFAVGRRVPVTLHGNWEFSSTETLQASGVELLHV